MLRPWLGLLTLLALAGCREMAAEKLVRSPPTSFVADGAAPRTAVLTSIEVRDEIPAPRPALRELRRPVPEPYPDLEPVVVPEAAAQPEAMPHPAPPAVRRYMHRGARKRPSQTRSVADVARDGVSVPALAVGGAGAGVAALSLAFLVDEPTTTTTATFGTMLGVGIAAMAAGGIMAIIDSQEEGGGEVAIKVAPSGLSIGGSF